MTGRAKPSAYGLAAFGACALLLGGPAAAQAGDPDTAPPPTTLPFEPTVPSTPPVERTPAPRPAPARPAPAAAAPADPLCTEIGPIIRAGVIGSRFATLSPSTAGGAVLGRFEAGDGLAGLGAAYCTVTIPAAAPVTADSPYNQVTCRLASKQGDAPYLEDMRERRDTIAARIADCPAVALWTGTAPDPADPASGTVTEDFVFTHPDVAVEIVVRARHREKAGQWPLDYIRTLELVFRTPNPDRPEPDPPADAPAPAPGN